jgi:hypothetical protein
MSTNVGSIHYDLDLKTQEFDKAAASIKSKTRELGSNLTSIGAKMTAGITLPVAIGMGVAVKRASDLQETINKVEVAFKENAQQVKEWSKSTIKNIGLAGSTAMDMAALFGDMGTSMGLTTKEAADMSVQLVNLAGDLASFKNISAEEARTALTGIFTGETESLKRLGIVMLETNLEQFALTKGTTKAWKEMSQAEKVALRYEYVLEKTKNAQGDFGRTSQGTANQLRITQEVFKELSEQMGAKLLPVVNKALGFLQKLVDQFSGLNPKIQNALIIIALIAAALGPLIMGLGLFLTALSAVASPVGLVILGVVALVAAIGYLHYEFQILNPVIDLFKKSWSMVYPQILVVVNMVKNDLVPQLTRLWNTLSPILIPTLKILGVIFGSYIVTSIMIFINILKSNIAVLGYMIAVLSNFIQWLRNVISWVGGVVNAIYGWTGLPGLVSNIFSSIRHNIVGNISGAIDTIWSFYGRFVDAGWGLIRAFANGIRGAFREAKDAVIGGLSDIRSYLPFSDAKKGPLSDLTLSGQRFSQTFAQGILNGSGYITNAVNKTLVDPSSAAGVNNSLGGNQSVSTSIYGNINIGNQQQSDQFFARLTRNQELASKNIATRVGAMG